MVKAKKKLFLAINGQKVETQAINEIIAYIKNGDVNVETLVWQKGWRNWRKTCEFKYFVRLINQYRPEELPQLSFEREDCSSDHIPCRPEESTAAELDNKEENDNKIISEEAQKNFLIGSNFYTKGDFQQAIYFLTLAIKINLEFVEALLTRGLVWAKLDEHDKAIQDFSIVIAIDPDFGPAYYCRSLSWYSKGDNDRFTSDHNAALGLNFEYTNAYNSCNKEKQSHTSYNDTSLYKEHHDHENDCRRWQEEEDRRAEEEFNRYRRHKTSTNHQIYRQFRRGR